jgi:hypothetical protein
MIADASTITGIKAVEVGYKEQVARCDALNIHVNKIDTWSPIPREMPCCFIEKFFLPLNAYVPAIGKESSYYHIHNTCATPHINKD